ncbi:MAG: hypothetical protein ACOY4H_02205 [Thermodesulfobacteriota bacterium]
MKKIRPFTHILLLALALTACVQAPAKKEPAPQAGPAATPPGLVINKDTEPRRIEIAISGTLGVILSSTMSGSDREKLVNVFEYNPDQHTSRWINVQSGNEFTATPLLTFADEKTGLNCREVELVAQTGGRMEKARSIACRKDGLWYFQ